MYGVTLPEEGSWPARGRQGRERNEPGTRKRGLTPLRGREADSACTGMRCDRRKEKKAPELGWGRLSVTRHLVQKRKEVSLSRTNRLSC